MINISDLLIQIHIMRKKNYVLFGSAALQKMHFQRVQMKQTPTASGIFREYKRNRHQQRQVFSESTDETDTNSVRYFSYSFIFSFLDRNIWKGGKVRE